MDFDTDLEVPLIFDFGTPPNRQISTQKRFFTFFKKDRDAQSAGYIKHLTFSGFIRNIEGGQIRIRY